MGLVILDCFVGVGFGLGSFGGGFTCIWVWDSCWECLL